MSAATVPLPSPPEPFATGIKGRFCWTRNSDVSVVRNMSVAKTAVITLIHVESLGWGRPWTKDLGMADFLAYSLTDSGPVRDAINEAMDEGLIEARGSGKKLQYRRLQPIDYDGREVLGQCPDCKKTTHFSLDWNVPMPQTLFSRVQQSLEHGAFMVVLLVAMETLKWHDGEIWVYPKEIEVSEFCRRLNRSRSEVMNDIRVAEERGFIASTGKRGAIQTYWALPGAWATAGVRLKRTGGNPKPGKRTESKPAILEIAETPKKTSKPSPVELWTKPHGKCHECGYHGPVDVVEASTQAPKRPVQQARAGPPPEIWSNHPSFVAPWKAEKKA